MEGGVGGSGTGRGGAASDYESLRPVERWPVGELVLSILSDAEERFQVFWCSPILQYIHVQNSTITYITNK